MADVRIVAIARVFPNRLEPLEGPFNRQQFGALGSHAGEPVHVLHAVPHLPFAARLGRPARAALLASLPDHDVIDGMPVTTLRHGYVPRVGLPVALPLFEHALRRHANLLASADVVLGSWAFPDGCAAVRVAHAMGKPCVVKMHGSDVNVVAKHPVAARAIARDLARAEAIVVMAKSLGRSLEALGVPADRIAFVPNGIDGARFFPRPVDEARKGTPLVSSAPIALFIGRLEPQKGLGDLLDAWPLVRAQVPGATLRLVGAGPLEARARATEGVEVLGAKPHGEIPRELHLANVFVLPSWAEGMPNVVLEALACGRPVVGSAVGGIPDALTSETAGTVVPPRDAASLAEALARRLRATSDPEAVARFGPPSWDASARSLFEVLERARATRPGSIVAR
jgi:teichuronic acid biosynthesis glycosyltransferase TuaC